MLRIDVANARLFARLPDEAIGAICACDGVVLSVRVAAKLVRRHPERLRGAIRAGTLRAITGGRYSYITPGALADWLGRGKFSAAEFRAAFRRADAGNTKPERRSAKEIARQLVREDPQTIVEEIDDTDTLQEISNDIADRHDIWPEYYR